MAKKSKKSTKTTKKITKNFTKCETCRLSIKGVALSLGIVWGVGMFLIGLASMTGYGVNFVNLFSKVYIGFAPTFSGSIIGGVWGFLDGLIGGGIIAFLYNKLK